MLNSMFRRLAALLNTFVQGEVIDAARFSKFVKAHISTLKSDVQRARRVAMLRRPIGPAAILWRVRPARIEAFNREPVWAWSHVGQEGREVVAPAFADRNAIRTVEAVVRRGFRVAARLHTSPNHVLATLDAFDDAAVLRVPACAHRALIAAAARRVTAQQVLAVLDRFLTAVAATAPMCAFRWMRDTFDRDEFAEALARQIFRLSPHSFNYNRRWIQL